jgi:carbon monoxide dehydrogenase subunit G
VKIEDEFRVDVPVDEAWKVLLDVERIAPCMPGAQLQEVEGDEYRGIVKVKVGPITAQYKGAARIVETDEAAHKLVLKADGRDTRGQGNASATVTATLTADGGGTRVHIDTDLNITGKVAQFGRGVMADVSSKLLGQFATNLERDVLSGNGSGAATPLSAGATAPAAAPSASPAAAASSAASSTAGASTAAETPGVRTVDAPEAEPVDLFDTAGNAVAKRVVPIVLALVAFLALRSLRKRRKRKRQQREE